MKPCNYGVPTPMHTFSPNTFFVQEVPLPPLMHVPIHQPMSLRDCSLSGGDSADSDTLCPLPTTAQTNSGPSYAAEAGSLITVTATAAVLVFAGAVIVKKCKKRRQKGAYKRLLADHGDVEYVYDIFLLCADEDEEFVTECVEKPLNELGYKTMRKNTAPDGLFALGNAVVSDIDHVIKLCSYVIVVCSINYTSSGGASRDSDIARNHCNIELNYCKELISSCNGRVIPIVLDEVGAGDFTEVTQHRVKTTDILSDGNARKIFIQKLERDICTINKR